jgi:predicted transcriptional regulator
MTDLLERAIAQVRELSSEDQERAAHLLLEFLRGEELDAETIAAIEEGLAQADRGEFVSDEEMAEFFRQRGA